MAEVQLPRGVRVEGIVRGDEDLVIEGEVDGAIHGQGRVTLAAGASCRGEIRARTVVLHGELLGGAVARERIEVGPGARVVGDLRAPEIAIDPRAATHGTVALAAPEPELIPLRRHPARVRGPGIRRPRPPFRVTEVVPDEA